MSTFFGNKLFNGEVLLCCMDVYYLFQSAESPCHSCMGMKAVPCLGQVWGGFPLDFLLCLC